MPRSKQQVRELLQEMQEIVERMDDFGSRLVGVEVVAAHHGDEHTDLGRDPVIQAGVTGHTHTGATPTGNNTLLRNWIGG